MSNYQLEDHKASENDHDKIDLTFVLQRGWDPKARPLELFGVI